MAGNKTNGLIALGLAAAAFWKWGMNAEQKANLKSKINDAGKNLRDRAQAAKNDLSQQVQKVEQGY